MTKTVLVVDDDPTQRRLIQGVLEREDFAVTHAENGAAAMTFLKWVGSQQFAELYGNALPGFFPLTNAKVTIKDPLANEFLSWRQNCKSTMRYTYQILSRGTPNLENALWAASANVINGTETPEAAAAVPYEFIDRTALLGPPERIVDRLQALAGSGVTTLSVAPYGAEPEQRLEPRRP